MLDRISVELIELIGFSLDDRSLLTCRLVSHSICQSLLKPFADRFFSLLLTDFSPRSLSRLSHISKRPELASRVRRLRVMQNVLRPLPETLPHFPDEEAVHFGQQYPRLEGGHLDLSSPPATSIRDVILRFTRCTDLSIVDDTEEWLWSDGEPRRLNPVDIFWLMVSILQRDGGTTLQVRKFELDCSESNKGTGSRWPSKAEFTSQLSNRSAWAMDLLQLTIYWNFQKDLVDNIFMPLIVSAANLKTLTICQVRSSDVDALPTGLTLAQIEEGRLPALSELKLVGGTPYSVAALIGVVRAFGPTLRSLCMSYIMLTPESIFGDVLDQLAAAPPGSSVLESITINCCDSVFFCPLLLDQDTMRKCGGDGFEFQLRRFKRSKRVAGVRYVAGRSGNMRLALSALHGAWYGVETRLSPKGRHYDGLDPLDSWSAPVDVVGAELKIGRVVRKLE
ncbi:hypothetical protein MN608_04089 [Microdochium nivale]|nr:hypothetical protein MN608_04089 [Microdochium nivale]